jgi:hypothetical protein
MCWPLITPFTIFKLLIILYVHGTIHFNTKYDYWADIIERKYNTTLLSQVEFEETKGVIRIGVYSGIRATRSLVLCVCFIDRCLSFCIFLLAIVLSAPLRYTDSDYTYGKQISQNRQWITLPEGEP